MNKVLKIFVWLVVFAVIIVTVFVAAIWVNEWVPNEVEQKSTGGLVADTIAVSDTLKIVSWNIGYAGLGADMDFFYDGGSSVRCSENQTKENIRKISEFLRLHRDADFILLQEVDFDSKRSYHMNQYDSIRFALPEFLGWWGCNYVSKFVPIPIFETIGEVKAGVVILSRHAPIEVVRLQYPSIPSFPKRLFDLKRCILTAAFRIEGTDELFYVGNTHNSAYDTNGKRANEMEYVRNYMRSKPYAIVAGDWNSNPPGYVASEAELKDPDFVPYVLKAKDFPADWSFIADISTKSARYGYEPYNPVTTTCTLLDFAIATKGIKPVSVETVDLGFKNSDHNPVVFHIMVGNDDK